MIKTAAIDLGFVNTGIAIFDDGDIQTAYIGSEIKSPHERTEKIIEVVKDCDMVLLEIYKVRDLADPEGIAKYFEVQHYVQRELRNNNIAYLGFPERNWRATFARRTTSMEINGDPAMLRCLVFLQNNFKKNEHVEDAVHFLFSQLTAFQFQRMLEKCK